MSLDDASGAIPSPLWPDKPGVMNILGIIKEGERYLYLFDDDSAAETLRTFGRHAVDQNLSFTWYDAAVLSQKMRALLAKKNDETNPL